MYITKNKEILEKKCEGVYYTEGVIIAKKLLNVVIFGKHKNCIGLAHNQIGGNKNIFIAKINNKWRCFINASIIKHSKDYIIHEESCMSFPKKSNKIKRYKSITIEHQTKARNDNRGGQFTTEEFVGFDACIIQHEMDHLNGIHIFNKEIKNV